jgi:hypothetical protein
VDEATVLEDEMTVSDATGLDDHEHDLLRHTNEVMIWVRFHPDAIPRRCEIHESRHGEQVAWPVSLSGITSAHHWVRAFGPGAVGVSWKF